MSLMPPLAVSGAVIIGAAIAIAVLLLIVLFRAEDRHEAEDERAGHEP